MRCADRSAATPSIHPKRRSYATAAMNCRVGIDARRAWCIRPRPQMCRRLFALRTNTASRSTASARARTGGIGLRSPIRPGHIIVDLGARMNRILEIDETLCFAAIEPGVTYQQMYDELGAARPYAYDGYDLGPAGRRYCREHARQRRRLHSVLRSLRHELRTGSGVGRRTHPADRGWGISRLAHLAHRQIRLRTVSRRPVPAIELRHRHPPRRVADAASAGHPRLLLHVSATTRISARLSTWSVRSNSTTSCPR